MIPDALLLITGGCAHCPGVQQALTGLLKEGVIGRLEVVNVAVHVEEAEKRGVESVPWTRIGPFEIHGVASVGEFRRYAQGVDDDVVLDDYVLGLLKSGKRARFESLVRQEPRRIQALARLTTNADAGMAIRLGIGAVLEELHGTGLTEPLVPQLSAMLESDDPLLRADACHFLTLIGGDVIRPVMRASLEHGDPEIREIAREWLEATYK